MSGARPITYTSVFYMTLKLLNLFIFSLLKVLIGIFICPFLIGANPKDFSVFTHLYTINKFSFQLTCQLRSSCSSKRRMRFLVSSLLLMGLDFPNRFYQCTLGSNTRKCCSYRILRSLLFYIQQVGLCSDSCRTSVMSLIQLPFQVDWTALYVHHLDKSVCSVFMNISYFVMAAAKVGACSHEPPLSLILFLSVCLVVLGTQLFVSILHAMVASTT